MPDVLFKDRKEEIGRVEGLVRGLPDATGPRACVIHGDGGIGKTQLLKEITRSCKESRTIIAEVNVGDVRNVVSPQDIIAGWASQIANAGVPLRKYTSETGNTASAVQRFATILATVPGAIIRTTGQQFDSLPPSVAIQIVFDIAATVLGDRFSDWFTRRISNQDRTLLRESNSILRHAFVADLGVLRRTHAVLLVLDKYEHIERVTESHNWVLSLIAELPDNVMLLCSGRYYHRERWYPDLLRIGTIVSISLEPFSGKREEYIRDLIRDRYEANECPMSEDDMNTIMRMSNGIPLIADTASQFRSSRSQFGRHDTTDDVTKPFAEWLFGDLSTSLRIALEAAACLRWFDRDVLKWILRHEIADADFVELCNFSFVQRDSVYPDRFIVHELYQEIIDHHLSMNYRRRHINWHLRAAEYFGIAIEKSRSV